MVRYGFLVKITHSLVVATVQSVRAERFPTINLPSEAKSLRSLPVSFLNWSAVKEALSPTSRFVRIDRSSSMVSGVMMCVPARLVPWMGVS